jgi:hypothetical protein
MVGDSSLPVGVVFSSAMSVPLVHTSAGLARVATNSWVLRAKYIVRPSRDSVLSGTVVLRLATMAGVTVHGALVDARVVT